MFGKYRGGYEYWDRYWGWSLSHKLAARDCFGVSANDFGFEGNWGVDTVSGGRIRCYGVHHDCTMEYELPGQADILLIFH